jgi:ABC-type antimicrobial peptide transport system permease subunit
MYSNILNKDGDIIVTQAKISDTFFSDVDINLTKKIKNINGIKKVSAMIVGATPVETLPIVAIYGITDNRIQNYKLLNGKYPENKEVLIGSSISKSIQNKKIITIGDGSYKVSGVFSSELGFENGGIIMTLKDAGKLFHKSASMLLINIDLKADIDKIVSQINSLSTKIEAKSTQGFIDNYNQFKIINYSSYAVSSIAFLMGLLSIASIMTITVNERKEEFGIKRALGIKSKEIVFSLIIENITIAVISYIVAVIFSFLSLYIIKNISFLHGYINGEITMFLAFGVFITTLFIVLLGSFIPAYKASKIDPMILIQRGS